MAKSTQLALSERTLTETSATAIYDPNLNWSITVQTEEGLPVEDYCHIAEQAEDELIRQKMEFYREHGFTTIYVSHEDFLKYEKSTVPFSKWLDAHCKKHGLNRNADVCLVSSLKTLESAKRKTATNNPTPDQVIDYLRCMPIVLKKSPLSKKNRESLDVLETLMYAAERDPRTIARKNYFWKPNPKTGISMHKTLQNYTVLEDSCLGGFQILVENKMLHESQIDLDRLTRKFLDFARETESAIPQFYGAGGCSSSSSSRSHKRADKHSRSMSSREEKVNSWGKMLYRRLNYDAGYIRFLDPKERVSRPLPMSEILSIIEMDLNDMRPGQQIEFREKLCASGLFPKNSSLGCDKLSLPERIFKAVNGSDLTR